MEERTIKKLIKLKKRKLRWNIEELLTTGALEIFSDPRTRTHTVRVPNYDLLDIEILHEYARATLAERVHPLLGTAIFKTGAPKKAIEQLKLPLRVATDWYADALLAKWAPVESFLEIYEQLSLSTEYPDEADDLESQFVTGLFVAQLSYRSDGRELPLLKQLSASYFPRMLIYLLHKNPPDNPSAGALEKLVNDLAALAKRRYRVMLYEENGFEVWDVEDFGD